MNLKKCLLIILNISIIIYNTQLNFANLNDSHITTSSITRITNAPYYNPSTTQLYEIFYQTDEKFRETIFNSPGIRNKNYYQGIMTNSVTYGSLCTGLLRYWKNDNFFDHLVQNCLYYLIKPDKTTLDIVCIIIYHLNCILKKIFIV